MTTPKRIRVKISSKYMNTLFVKCNIAYIKSHCKGVCCRNTKNILNVAVSPREQYYIESLGAKVKKGLLQPNINGIWCPFQKQNGLCSIHKKAPIGCVVSPFNLNTNNTVIIRYRNLCMTCHKKGTIPAYQVFKKSLEAMFGKKETNRICSHLDNKGNDIYAYMFGDVYEDLVSNIKIRKMVKIKTKTK